MQKFVPVHLLRFSKVNLFVVDFMARSVAIYASIIVVVAIITAILLFPNLFAEVVDVVLFSAHRSSERTTEDLALLASSLSSQKEAVVFYNLLQKNLEISFDGDKIKVIMDEDSSTATIHYSYPLKFEGSVKNAERICFVKTADSITIYDGKSDNCAL